MIGALVVSEAGSAGKAVASVVSALRAASVTEEQVAGAKNQLLSDVYTLMEDPLQLVENMGAQVRERSTVITKLSLEFKSVLKNHIMISQS